MQFKRCCLVKCCCNDTLKKKYECPHYQSFELLKCSVAALVGRDPLVVCKISDRLFQEDTTQKLSCQQLLTDEKAELLS